MSYLLPIPGREREERSEKKQSAIGKLQNRIKMVCIACLLPLFLVPIVNLLPVLFDFIMAKIYRLFGWEYRKPERAPPACPYKPSASKSNNNSVSKSDPVASDNIHKPILVDDNKE